MGKSHKKVWLVTPLCIFWTVWKERNLLVFDNKDLSIQRLKNYFVCNLWSWSRVSVDMSPISLVSFIDWLNSKQGYVMIFTSFPLPLGWASRHLLYTLRALLLASPLFFLYYFSLLIKKKKNSQATTNNMGPKAGSRRSSQPAMICLYWPLVCLYCPICWLGTLANWFQDDFWASLVRKAEVFLKESGFQKDLKENKSLLDIPINQPSQTSLTTNSLILDRNDSTISF